MSPRGPRKAALRVAFPASSGRRERLPMGPHRRRVPSCRGNGKNDRIVHESLGQDTKAACRGFPRRRRPLAAALVFQSYRETAPPRRRAAAKEEGGFRFRPLYRYTGAECRRNPVDGDWSAGVFDYNVWRPLRTSRRRQRQGGRRRFSGRIANAGPVAGGPVAGGKRLQRDSKETPKTPGDTRSDSKDSLDSPDGATGIRIWPGPYHTKCCRPGATTGRSNPFMTTGKWRCTKHVPSLKTAT